MDDKFFLGTVGHHLESSERKYPNGHCDVKRKLTFIRKKIGDLQHRRKSLYKNSAKVKRVIHNHINQIVKCLRARERSLWTDVDEAYIAQDEHISEELALLQSVHARCQALFEHVDDNKKTVDVLDKIYSTLSEAKFGEKRDVKALEFMSDFETIKSLANSFGHLEGDFVKKDEFVFINKRETNSSDPVGQEFHDKNECSEKILPLTTVRIEHFEKEYPNSTESEDSFEIVDLLESMCCEDTVMVEQGDSGNGCLQEEYVESSSGNKSKFLKISNGLENTQKAVKNNDFNPEEEWKQIFEMRNRIANFKGISSKLSKESKDCEIQNAVSNCLSIPKCDVKNYKQNTYLAPKEADSWLHDRNSRKEKLNIKNFMQNKFLCLKEADNWLHNKSLKRDTLNKERNSENINTGINSDSSPAEIIRQAFSPYLTKGSIHNWLLCN